MLTTLERCLISSLKLNRHAAAASIVAASVSQNNFNGYSSSGVSTIRSYNSYRKHREDNQNQLEVASGGGRRTRGDGGDKVRRRNYDGFDNFDEKTGEDRGGGGYGGGRGLNQRQRGGFRGADGRRGDFGGDRGGGDFRGDRNRNRGGFRGGGGGRSYNQTSHNPANEAMEETDISLRSGGGRGGNVNPISKIISNHSS